MNKYKNNIYCLMIAAGLILSPILPITSAQAVDAPQVTAEQQAQEKTIAEMKQELASLRETSKYSAAELKNLVGRALWELNPMLVGDNVVFSEKWQPYIGETISEENFPKFRNETDKIFESYAELSGKLPWYGQKIFMEIDKNLPAGHLAHSHSSHNQTCFKPNTVNEMLKSFEAEGTLDFSNPHELGHQFNAGNRFEVEFESSANFFVAYLLEHTDISINNSYWKRVLNLDGPLQGDNFRKALAKKATEEYKKQENPSKKMSFATRSDSTYSTFDMYLYNLVDLYGWDIFKQAFRSYDSLEYQKIIDKRGYIYWGNSPQAKATDLFDRLEYFAKQDDLIEEDQSIFAALPDEGILRTSLLEECEKVTPEVARKYPSKIDLIFDHPNGTRYRVSIRLDKPTHDGCWDDLIVKSINEVLKPAGYKTLKNAKIFYNGKEVETIGDIVKPNPYKSEFDVSVTEKATQKSDAVQNK